jgi:acetyltransferase-like isoleucine patch superfamily enzyme
VTVAYGVKIFSQSDDYSGNTMTNSLIPTKYKNEYKAEVIVEKYSIIGANSTILPGVNVAEGSSIGAMTLILKSTTPWGIYVGIPGKRVKDRSREMLKLVDEFHSESNK